MKRTYVKWWRLFRDSPQWEGLGIARTLVLSATVGAGAGLGAVLLVAMLQITQWFFFGFIANYEPSVPVGEPVFLKNLPEITGEIRRWTFLFLPAVGGLISGIIVHRFAPEAAGHGTDAAIEAYHFRGGRVRPAVPPIKAIATSLLIGSGGSAGCEGPITQIGSGFGSVLASALKLRVAERRALMAAGMGAGVGALFHAPMAGALFAAEVLYRDLDLEYEVLIPSIIASVTGYSVFSKVFGFHALFETPPYGFSRPEILPLYLLLAVVLAGGAQFYTWFFYSVHEKFEAVKISPALKPAIGGLLTGLVGFMFLPGLGSGYGIVQEALHYDWHMPREVAMSALGLMAGVFVLKTLTTSFSVGSGGSGGIFGPALVLGATLGGAVGIIFSLLLPGLEVPVGSFVMVGMVAFFGCAAKTPISVILMVGEMTANYRLLVPSMWVCMIAYMLSRRVSLYRAQLPNRFDAPIHRGEMISGVVRNIVVRDLLGTRRDFPFMTVQDDTPLSLMVDALASGMQSVFPVVGDDGRMLGEVTSADLESVVTSDPMLRATLMVSDIALQKHACVSEDDMLQTALRHMDREGVDNIVVVSSDNMQRPVGILSHNDVVTALRTGSAG